jgi:nucleoside-diphosphate-sugar epimerase
MNSKQRIALVLGANGGVGGEVTKALLRRGWRVRALVRRQPSAEHKLRNHQVDWRIGDALNRQDVMNAAHEASVIVHAVNPAKYHDWRGLALPMLDNTIAAADANRARIVLPGTIYNYGHDAFPLIGESAPQNPHTRKGAVRVEMEERLRDASWDGRVRALIVRAGDFFGPYAVSSWFSEGVVMRGQPVRFVFTPGKKHLSHSWAYLPDVAETIVRLLEQENSLQKFDVFHFKGHWLSNGEMMNAICDVAGISHRRILPLPWWALRAAASFAELYREMQEMRYLWNEPVELDNAKLRAQLGCEPHTPIEQAIRDTLIGIGCLNSGNNSTAAPAGTY